MPTAEEADVRNSVLIVDNVTESQESTSSLLEAEGYDVSSVSDGDTALKTIAKTRPAAILFRVLDPPVGAIDFVRRLALSRHVMSVPVVVVTALNEYQVGSFLDGVPGIRRVVHSASPPKDMLAAVAQAVQYSKS